MKQQLVTRMTAAEKEEAGQQDAMCDWCSCHKDLCFCQEDNHG